MDQCTTTEICGPPVEQNENDDESKPQVEVARSSTFWFEDGNVVLQAEHTQFRLHRSVLSMHCPIFRDMFACSLPENGPTVDGCPLVNLSETLEDVKNFVKILYRSIRTYNRTDFVTVSLLRTMLHFGRKYDMEWLREEAVYCLELEFPSTLQQWSNQFFNDVDGIIEGIDSEEIPRTSLFEILHLAYEHSITSILPALYLHICLTHNAQEIVKGFQRVAKKSHLKDDSLLINCLLGREHLHRSVSSVTLAWLHDNNALSSSDCQHKTSCQKKRSMLITKLWNNDIQYSLKFALYPWENIMPMLSEGLCSSCLEAALAAYLKARIVNWDQLSQYFLRLGKRAKLPSNNSSQSDANAEAEDEAGL